MAGLQTIHEVLQLGYPRLELGLVVTIEIEGAGIVRTVHMLQGR